MPIFEPKVSAVWILDVSAFVDIVDRLLEALVPQYNWLAAPLNQGTMWHWSDGLQEYKTQKEQLIEWIIREEFTKQKYLHIENHLSNETFSRIHNQLQCQEGLETLFSRHVLIPRVYGDMYLYRVIVELSYSGLYIQFVDDHPTTYTPASATPGRKLKAV